MDGWALATPLPGDDAPKRSGVVKLNIGGVKYETTVGTLVSHGDNFFTTLFSNKFPALKDEEGYYFIDRDGEYFKPLLSYLRTGELRIPPGMSKVCVEREAHFYLIDLNDGAPHAPSVYHPSSLGSSFAPNPRFYLRYDGVYVQKTRDGEDFFAYYRFFRNGKVSIVTTSRHKLQNKVNNTYEIVEGEWLLIRSNFQRKPTILMGTFGYNSIQIHWRSPRDKKHLDSNALHFFPSLEPPTDLIFSNQHCRMGKKQYHRLNFKDDRQVTITVMEKDQQHRLMNSIKRTATYGMEKEEIVTIHINDDFFPEPLISLGTILMERRHERQVVGQRETCRVYLAVDKQLEEEEEEDEIDIYTFLRTSSPPVGVNDDDTDSSDDDYRDPYAAATITNNDNTTTTTATNANVRTRSERSLSQ